MRSRPCFSLTSIYSLVHPSLQKKQLCKQNHSYPLQSHTICAKKISENLLLKMSDQQATTRESIDLAIKDNIRSFYETHPKLKVSDMVLWAEEKYGIQFPPATMRTILFPKRKKPLLWTAPRSSLRERKRERPPSWPELELELSKWYASSTIPPRGQDIKEKAIGLWRELAPKHYPGQERPGFGDSWRDKFKNRHGFKLGKAPAQENLMENRAPSVLVEAKDTNIPRDVDDKTGRIRVIRSPTGEYKATHSSASS